MEESNDVRKKMQIAQFLTQLSERERRELLGEVTSERMKNLGEGTQGLGKLGERDELRVNQVQAFGNCRTICEILESWADHIEDDEIREEVKNFYGDKSPLLKKLADEIYARSQTQDKVPDAFLDALSEAGVDIPYIEPEEEEVVEEVENEDES